MSCYKLSKYRKIFKKSKWGQGEDTKLVANRDKFVEMEGVTKYIGSMTVVDPIFEGNELYQTKAGYVFITCPRGTNNLYFTRVGGLGMMFYTRLGGDVTFCRTFRSRIEFNRWRKQWKEIINNC